MSTIFYSFKKVARKNFFYGIVTGILLATILLAATLTNAGDFDMSTPTHPANILATSFKVTPTITELVIVADVQIMLSASTIASELPIDMSPGSAPHTQIVAEQSVDVGYSTNIQITGLIPFTEYFYNICAVAHEPGTTNLIESICLDTQTFTTFSDLTGSFTTIEVSKGINQNNIEITTEITQSAEYVVNPYIKYGVNGQFSETQTSTAGTYSLDENTFTTLVPISALSSGATYNYAVCFNPTLFGGELCSYSGETFTTPVVNSGGSGVSSGSGGQRIRCLQILEDGTKLRGQFQNGQCEYGVGSSTPGNNPNTTAIAVQTLRVRKAGTTFADVVATYNAPNCIVTGYFMYGLNPFTLSLPTPVFTGAAGTGAFSAIIPNLQTETTYYYHAVLQGCGNTVVGDVQRLTTARPYIAPVATIPTPTLDTPTAFTSFNETPNEQITEDTPVPFMQPRIDLTIDNNSETVRSGEIITYSINIKNLGIDATIPEAVLHINLPIEVEFINTSHGAYDRDTHAVFAQLGDLDPSEAEYILIQTQARSGSKEGDIVSAQATLTYKDPSGGNQSIVAYDYDRFSRTTNTSVARVAQSGAFFPSSFGGWLVLLLVLLGIALVSHYAFIRPRPAVAYTYAMTSPNKETNPPYRPSNSNY
ncbi:MAG: hypothetical protein ACI83D_000175 [Planctomycetota bacterium]|jgi:hypothetical protein